MKIYLKVVQIISLFKETFKYIKIPNLVGMLVIAFSDYPQSIN